MPVTYRGKSYRTYSEFETAYAKRNPDLVPIKQTPSVPLTALLILSFVFAATNVLSAGHTIPSIQKFYDVSSMVSGFIGVAGFIGIEASLVFLMSRPSRGSWEWSAIAAAFTTALTINLYSTFEVVQGSILLLGVALITGSFPPLMNLALGEILHRTQKERHKTLIKAEADYLEDLGRYRNRAWSAYEEYLKRVGLTSREKREAFFTFLEAGVDDDPPTLSAAGGVVQVVEDGSTTGESSTTTYYSSTGGSTTVVQGTVQESTDGSTVVQDSTTSSNPVVQSSTDSSTALQGVVQNATGGSTVVQGSTTGSNPVVQDSSTVMQKPIDQYRVYYPQYTTVQRLVQWSRDVGYSLQDHSYAEIKETYGGVSNTTISKARKM